MSKPDSGSSAGRLMEIIGVLQKHNAIRGITPEKLRQIVEDLGPTFVKLGQMLSLRADLLPPARAATHELAEHAFENVGKAGKVLALTATAATVAERGMTEAVIGGALLRILQAVIRFADRLELGF